MLRRRADARARARGRRSSRLLHDLGDDREVLDHRADKHVAEDEREAERRPISGRKDMRSGAKPGRKSKQTHGHADGGPRRAFETARGAVSVPIASVRAAPSGAFVPQRAQIIRDKRREIISNLRLTRYAVWVPVGLCVPRRCICVCACVRVRVCV